MCICVSVCEHMHVCMQYPHSPEEGIESPGAGIIGSRQWLHVGAGNWILDLRKSSAHP